jgi:hypothetical protein
MSATLVAAAALLLSTVQCNRTEAYGEDRSTVRDSYTSLAALPEQRMFRTSSGSKVIILGTEHGAAGDSSQARVIQQVVAKARNAVVLAEGNGWPESDTPDATLAAWGEIAFAAHVAATRGIPTISVEPPFDLEASSIVALFGARNGRVFYALRYAASLSERRRTEAEIRAYLQFLDTVPALQGEPRTFLELAVAAAELGVADVLSVKANQIAPLRWSSNPATRRPSGDLLVEISRCSNEFRDMHMTNAIVDAAREKGRTIIVVYGRAHLYAQERDLWCRLEGLCRRERALPLPRE